MAAYLTKLDEYLRTPGHIDQTFTLIEEKAKIQRKYVGLGVAIIAMGLIFSTLAPLVVNLIAFLYPAYKSIKVINNIIKGPLLVYIIIKALESNDKDDDTKWLTYWVVYGFFSCAEFFADLILSWFPFYFIAKVSLLGIIYISYYHALYSI